MARESTPHRDETPAERIDRNWNELLQELRVTQTGVQILLAFLLMLPFQNRFETLEQPARWVYAGVVVLVVISAVLNMAPVITHRILFRRHLKDDLLQVSDVLTKLSFLALGLAIIGGVALALHLAIGPWGVGLITGSIALLVLALWLAMPLVMRRGAAQETDPDY